MLGALATATVLGVVGMTACGSDSESDQPSSPDTSVVTKNGVVKNTTTTVPRTIQMPHGGSGGKPKR